MKSIFALILAASAAFFMPVATAATDTAQLSWVAPTTSEDGSELNDLAGYGVFVKLPGDPDFVRVPDPNGTGPLLIPEDETLFTYVIDYPDGTAGAVEFFVIAIDDAGNESVPSNIAIRQVDDVAPSPPTLEIIISLQIDEKTNAITIAGVTTRY